jgi:hypothetical protein
MSGLRWADKGNGDCHVQRAVLIFAGQPEANYLPEYAIRILGTGKRNEQHFDACLGHMPMM